MSILAWIEDQRKLKLLNAPKYNHPASDGSKGLWTRCDHCGVILYIKHLKENRRVCFGCGYHLQMNSQERIDHLIDAGTWRSLDETLSPCDPLEFWDQKAYIERLKESQERTGLQDAVQTGTGMLYDIPIALGVMDFYFMGGSMGSVVGEKITRLIEYASQEGLTLILVCASGGARMQEGVLSLMQMAKISGALQIYQSCANLLYISILTSPTTGGVTASFAMLGDLIFAEPKALIGFAGRRVIEQTLQEQLPDDFQTSEYLLHHGLLDLIIPRSFFKSALLETITLYKDAPLKRSGNIPYGIQQNLNFITEEKIRRKWESWKQITGYSVHDKSDQVAKSPALLAELIPTALQGENCLEKLNALYKTKSDASNKKNSLPLNNQNITVNSKNTETMYSVGDREPAAQGVQRLGANYEYEIPVEFPRNTETLQVQGVSESLYREILVSFQGMLEFFSLPILNDKNVVINQILTNKNFDKFIFKSKRISTKKDFHATTKKTVFSSEDLFLNREATQNRRKEDSLNSASLDFQVGPVKQRENVLNSTNDNTFFKTYSTPDYETAWNKEIIEWRILYATQNSDVKKNFLETFIKGKHKNFFYKSII